MSPLSPSLLKRATKFPSKPLLRNEEPPLRSERHPTSNPRPTNRRSDQFSGAKTFRSRETADQPARRSGGSGADFVSVRVDVPAVPEVMQRKEEP